MNDSIAEVIKIMIEGGKTFIETNGSYVSAGVAIGHRILEGIVDVGSDYINRQLSKVEEDRVTRSLNHIKSGISAKIAKGAEVNSKFFDNNQSNRAPSVEICEGVLQKCKLEYEELKIPFISNIFVEAPFISEYSASEIFYRLTIAEKLTYRQLCILAMINNNTIVDSLRKIDYVEGYKSSSLRSLLAEILDLNSLGLIENYDRNQKRSFGFSGILSIVPYNLKLTKSGKRQYELMDLSMIDLNHIDELMKMLE